MLPGVTLAMGLPAELVRKDVAGGRGEAEGRELGRADLEQEQEQGREWEQEQLELGRGS